MKWYAVTPRMGNMKDSFETTNADFKGFNPRRLYTGTRIEDWPAGVEFIQEDEEPWSRIDDVLMNSYMDIRTFHAYIFPIYSPRLQTAIETAGIRDFQFLPCRLRDAKGNEVGGGYSVANVLTFRDALDANASKIYYFDTTLPRLDVVGNIGSIYRAALRLDDLADCHACRVPSEPEKLFVSDLFRRTYRRLKATGVSFKDVLLID